MDAPDAMDLPLDMALALLKDDDGVIDLDLSVSGNMDEPEFDIGQVIRQALGNALGSETDRGIAARRLRLLDPTDVDSGDAKRVVMEIGIAPD